MAVAVAPVSGEPLTLLAVAALDPDTPPAESSDALDTVSAGDPPALPVDRRWLSLTSSISDPGSTALQELLERGERWHLVHVGAVANPRPLKARMTVFGEIPYMAGDASAGVPAPGDTHEPASLGVTAQAGGFEVGVVYRAVGPRPERTLRAPTVRANWRGREVWVARRVGLVRVRVSQSRLSDNVHGDPALPRTTEEQTAITAELSRSSWPVVGLTYAAGDAEREHLTPDGPAGAPERHAFERVTGSTSYGGARWEIAASSSFAQSRDAARTDGESVATSHAVRLALRPADGVTVVPAVTVGQTRDEWSAARTDSGSAALALTYAAPTSRWSGSTTLSYTTTRANDGAVDGRTMGVNGTLGCRLGRRVTAPSTLWLEAGYGRYVDAVVPGNSSDVIWVSLNLRVAVF